MARSYSGKKGSALQLYGFDAFYEKLEELQVKGIPKIVEQAFDEDCKIVKDAMETYAHTANVSAKLINAMTEEKEIEGNRYSYAYGWDDKKHHKEKLIAAYLNYGTPRRITRGVGQKIYLDGRWITLWNDRGRITARYFITNAKRSAAQKLRKNHKKLIQDVMNELRK